MGSAERSCPPAGSARRPWAKVRRPLRLAFVVLLALPLSASAEPPRALQAPPATPELLDQGRAVFMANCAACHGTKGDGNGPIGRALRPRPRDFTRDRFRQGTSAEEIFRTLTEGIPGTPMGAWSHLSEDERWAATHLVLTMMPKAQGSAQATAEQR